MSDQSALGMELGLCEFVMRTVLILCAYYVHAQWKMSDKSALGMELGQEVSLAPLYSKPIPAAASPTFSVGMSTKVRYVLLHMTEHMNLYVCVLCV